MLQIISGILNYEFPIEVEHIWQFIQNTFYGLNVKDLHASTIPVIREIQNEK